MLYQEKIWQPWWSLQMSRKNAKDQKLHSLPLFTEAGTLQATFSRRSPLLSSVTRRSREKIAQFCQKIAQNGPLCTK
jgi:hypothetical protein